MSSDDTSQVEMRLDERSGSHVAVVTINNASRLNAMHSALMDEFVEKLSPLVADAQLRALVLTGAGNKAFIGGADIREMSALANAEDGRRFITRLHRCCDAIRAIPVPTIARINGLTLGGGLEIAAACDVRIAAQSAVFGMPEVKSASVHCYRWRISAMSHVMSRWRKPKRTPLRPRPFARCRHPSGTDARRH
jgi:enoyl-CoA hydratase